MRWIAIACLCSLLGACATASQTYGPDGKVAYTIDCSGAARTWAECQQKAGDICGSHGYRIVSVNGQTDPALVATMGTVMGMPVIFRTMEISCKGQQQRGK